MKYLEELDPGDCFDLEDSTYVLSSDYKKNGDRNCISLNTGFNKWISSDSIVDICPVYKLDEENNIVAIKPTEK
jgi:hypothetical protein